MSTARHRPILPLFAVAAVAILFFQDTLARAGIQGPVTIALFGLGVLLAPFYLSRMPRVRPGRELPAVIQPYPPGALWLMPVYAATLLALVGGTVNGVQNTIMYALLPMAAYSVAATATPGTPDLYVKWVTRVGVVAALVYVGLSTVVGAGSIEGWHGARGAGWGGVFALATIIPFVAYQHRSKWPVWIIFAAVVLSLSRTPSAIALGLLVLLAVGGTRFQTVLRGAVALGLLAWAARWAFINVPEVQQRFVQGDGSALFGISLNTSGRSYLWDLTLYNWSSSGEQWLGLGPGAAMDYLASVTRDVHPHNDYLRLVHDVGWVGLALWAAGILAVLRVTWRRWRQATDPTDRACHLAALACVGAFLAGMVTDNMIITLLDVLPTAVMIGLSASRCRLAPERWGAGVPRTLALQERRRRERDLPPNEETREVWQQAPVDQKVSSSASGATYRSQNR